MVRKLLLYVFMCIFAYSCVRMPKNTYVFTSDVVYTFEGGSDMLSLFNMEASYLDSNNVIVSENITSLPWTKEVRFKTSCTASLNVIFRSISDIPDKKTYNIGYRGDIKYATKYVREKATAEEQFSFTKTVSADNNYQIIKFGVVFSTPQQAEKAKLSIPYLKYNKHFALSYTVDDTAEGAYAKLWSRINKKWIDDVEFFHKQCKPTTGYTPQNTLGYTDGCGNERRFPVAVSIWPNASNQWSPNGYIVDSSNSTYSPYITWEEILDILDFGGTVYYHNIDEDKYGNTDYNKIINGMNDDRAVVYSKLGRYMKVMALPDGNKNYLIASDNNNNIVMSRAFEDEPNLYLNKITSLYKKRIATGGNGESPEQILKRIASESVSENPYWLSFTAHKPDNNSIRLFEQINKLYGKDGEDNIWFTTLDEVYEYVTMRNGAKIVKSVSGQVVEFEVAIPTDKDFYYKDLSFILESDDVTAVNPISENIVGLSSASTPMGRLINVNFNKEYISLSEKYTYLFETTLDSQYKDDAEYFISYLRPSLAQIYNTRLGNVNMYPVILSSIIVNGGDRAVFNNVVTVDLIVKNNPTHYKIWEGEETQDGEWIPYKGNSCIFEFKDSYGSKKINIKLKDSVSESETVSSNVEYRQFPQNGVLSKRGVLEYMKKHDGFIWVKEVVVK